MVETLQNLEHVFAKWEKKNPWNRGAALGGSSSSTSAHTVSNGNSSTAQKEHLDSLLENGRRHWNEKFSAAGLPPPSRQTFRRRNRGNAGQAALSLTAVNAETLASFKTAPSILPLSCRVRPYMGRCCSCMAASRAEFYNPSISTAGLHNVFNLDTKQKENSILVRTFPQLVHAWRRRIDHRYPDVSLAVLTAPRVQQAIQQTVREITEESGESNAEKVKRVLRTEQKRARRVMQRMRAAISNRLIRLTGWFLHHFFGRLLNSIIIHRGQLELLKHATEKDVPLILLPTHRSHLDYILVTWIMYNIDIRAPHVAAGDNLLIPFFGPLMRGLGGYFIRRKIDKHGKKDHIYRAVLHTYMQELLREGESFEVFIEGGRTRSGKALMPKGGILSVVVDAYNENIIPDAMLVPISISYDRILDGEFNNEQMGNPKIHETFFRACVSIWKVLSGHYGNVRIDICQPFSLKEYLQVSNSFPIPVSAPSPEQEGVRGQEQEGVRGQEQEGVKGQGSAEVRHRGSNISLYGTDCVVEDMRVTIQGLAEHVIYSATQSQAVMSFDLLAFLLLNKYRQGVTVAALRQTFGWLRQEVTNHGRDLGFTGSTDSAIQHACELHSHLLHIEAASSCRSGDDPLEHDNTVIRPVTSLPQVFSLTYYANVLTPMFAVESVITNAIHVSVRGDEWLSDVENKITVSRDGVISKALELCRLLRYEFVFTPSCTELQDVLRDGVDRLLAAELIVTEQEVRVYEDTREREWAEALSRSLACENEDESEEESNWSVDHIYRVNRECAESMERYELLRGVIAPIIECYFILACNLTQLEDKPMPEADFIKQVHRQLISRVQSGVSQCGASAALDTVRNGVHGLEHIKVLESYTRGGGGDNVTMLSLSPTYSRDKLTQFLASLEAYRS